MATQPTNGKNGITSKLLTATISLLCTLAVALGGYGISAQRALASDLNAHKEKNAAATLVMWQEIAKIREELAVLPRETQWLSQRLNTFENKLDTVITELQKPVN